VEHFMRTCVLALAAIVISQPALARDTSHKSHHLKRHHHAAHAGTHHYVKRHRALRRVVRVPATPIESGYAMPRSFARTDAMDSPFSAWGAASPTFAAPTFAPRASRTAAMRAQPARNSALDAMIARHAAANGLPVDLVHRVVIRESRYNPRARNGSNLGLMQIKHATARGVGYTGSAAGLFDAETNLTYAVRYLAGAYRAAGGNSSRAVAYYASGYHGRGVARTPVVTAQAAPAYMPMQAMPVAMRDTDMVTYAPQRYRARRR